MTKHLLTISLTAVISVFLIGSYTFASADSGDQDSPSITSKEALVYNLTEDDTLYKKSAETPISIDNLSILMTVTLAMDQVDSGDAELSDRISVSKKAFETNGPSMFLETDHKPTMDEIIQGLIIRGGEDAAVAFAEHHSNSVDQFVDEMNQKADELDMKNTTFTSPYGTSEDTSTADDLFKLTTYIMDHHEEFLSYFSQDKMEYDPVNDDGPYTFKNENSYLDGHDKATGLKSGWGEHYHLITTTTVDNMDYLIITLGDNSSAERNKNTDKLVDYISDAYKTLRVADEGDVYDSFYVYKSDENGPEDVIYSDNVDVFVSKDVTKDQLEYEYQGNDYIVGGLDKHDKVGKLVVKYDDEILGQTDVLTTKPFPKAGFFSSVFDSFAIFFNHKLLGFL